MVYKFIFLYNSFYDFRSSSKTKIYLIFLFLFLVIFYLIKYYKNLNNNLKLLLIVAVVGGFFGVYIIVIENLNHLSLLKNYKVTSGRVDSYFLSKSKGLKGQSTNRVSFSYTSESVTISNSYYENQYVEIPDVRPNLSVNYLVIYDSKNTENSYMLFNYPIKIVQDFNKYSDLFKKKIPTNVFKNF